MIKTTTPDYLHTKPNIIMKIIYIIFLMLTFLMLSGCNKQTPTASCSSTDTQKLMNQLLIEQALKLTTEKRYDQYDGSFVFGANKIRASLAQIQVAVENIKTINQEPNSSKSFCNGLLKVTVPTAMLTDVEQVRDTQHQLKIAQYARQLNIENSNNIFTQTIEYSVKPTGNGKEPLVEFEGSAWAHLLDEITTAVLLKPTLDVQDSYSVQEYEQPKQAIESLEPEADQAKLETDNIRTLQEKQGLDKLNKELLEAEQVEKELSQTPNISNEPIPKPAVSKSAPPEPKLFSPSFNCTNATKPTELTICATPELAALDVENMQIFKKSKSTDPVATNAIWKASIKSKYACGTDVDCIKTVYKNSIRHYSCVAVEETSDCDTQ